MGYLQPAIYTRRAPVTTWHVNTFYYQFLLIKKLISYSICTDSYESDLRDWSLITGRGGYKTGGGGACEVLPLRKGGAEKVLAMLKRGHKKFWGSFHTVA